MSDRRWNREKCGEGKREATGEKRGVNAKIKSNDADEPERRREKEQEVEKERMTPSGINVCTPIVKIDS